MDYLKIFVLTEREAQSKIKQLQKAHIACYLLPVTVAINKMSVWHEVGCRPDGGAARLFSTSNGVVTGSDAQSHLCLSIMYIFGYIFLQYILLDQRILRNKKKSLLKLNF